MFPIKIVFILQYRPPQGKSRLLHRKTRTACPAPVTEKKKPVQNREQGSHSSPPMLVDNRNAKNNRLDRINNNVSQTNLKKRYAKEAD